jgi:NADH:ubiquinone oxidoreductase subunit E
MEKNMSDDRTPQQYLHKHVLICTGKSCEPQGGEGVRSALKDELRSRGLRKFIRDGECTCLGLCKEGVNAVIWPEGTYLAGISKKDVPRLVDFLEGKGPPLSDLEELADRKIDKKLRE